MCGGVNMKLKVVWNLKLMVRTLVHVYVYVRAHVFNFGACRGANQNAGRDDVHDTGLYVAEGELRVGGKRLSCGSRLISPEPGPDVRTRTWVVPHWMRRADRPTAGCWTRAWAHAVPGKTLAMQPCLFVHRCAETNTVGI
jgi:hypothetical protein